MKSTAAIASMIVLLFVCALPATAQTKAGTSIGQFLKIEPSARSAAMGNTAVATYDGIQAVYYNPAALGALDAVNFQFTHSEWYADVNYDYGATAFALSGLGTFFASVTSLNSGNIAVRTVDQPLGTGENYTVSNVALGVGFGRQLTSRFSAGIQVNYLEETIWHTSLNALTLNVGTVYLLSPNGMRIGASIANLGTTSRYSGGDLLIQYDADPDVNGDNSSLPGTQFTDTYPVPIVFRAGISYPRRIAGDSVLLLQVDGTNPSDNTESLSGGAEWEFREVLSLRAGYQHLFEEDSEIGVTLGVGLKSRASDMAFQFDYAWADHARLQDTHRLTFVLSF